MPISILYLLTKGLQTTASGQVQHAPCFHKQCFTGTQPHHPYFRVVCGAFTLRQPTWVFATDYMACKGNIYYLTLNGKNLQPLPFFF